MRNTARRIALVLVAFCLAGCASVGSEKTVTAGDSTATVRSGNGYAVLEGFAMDTVVRLEYWGTDAEKAAEDAFVFLKGLEEDLSVTSEDGEIARLNRSAGEDFPLSDGTYELLSRAQGYCRETDGAFDPALLRLKEAWGWLDEPHVPDPGALERALAASGSDKVVLSDGKARLTEGAGVDLGGVAKGYAAQELALRASSMDVDAALINLGGNIQTYGRKRDGTEWKIGIRDPEDPSGILGVLRIDGRDCVVTSGAYERSFTEDGVTYGHILDAGTGRPADTDLVSVTVTRTDAARADALSTALFVMGSEKAAAFRKARGDFECVLLRKDGTVLVSAGISSTFSTGSAVQTIEP